MSLYLSPSELKIERAPDGTLRAHLPEFCARRVEVLRAMPLSIEDRIFVLRDGGGREIGILESLAPLDSATRELVEESLRDRYFLPQILKINALSEKFGSSTWEVETDRGPITINTKAMHESISEIAPGRYLLRDTGDNRFEIRDVNALDEESRMRFAGKY